MLTRRFTALVIWLTPLGAVAGCGGSGQDNVSSTAAASVPGTELGETVYPDYGVRTATPPAGTTPRLGQSQAIAIAEASDFKSGGLMPGTPAAAVRLYTDHDWPQSKAAPPFPVSGARNVDRLAWILTYAGSPVFDTGGPATGPGETPAPVPSDMPQFTYDFVMVIDANSGEIIGAFQPGRRVQRSNSPG